MNNTDSLQTIPADLIALPQWVCWHYQDRNGKRTKPPIDPKSNGKLLNAKSNDPATWSDFATAVATAERLNLSGIGLALSATDGLTGLDLDHVFDPATGEIDPLAVEVLSRFQGTYAEVSPSETGLRIWCYGKPERSGKCAGKVKWLEVYSHPSNRYLTVTGNHWPSSATAVTEQQDALNWLHSRFMTDSTGEEGIPHSLPVESPHLDDAALISKASKARNGAAFDALWSGDTSGHGGDHSSADMALLNLLAFWTDRDATWMDRLFRQSGLMRAKWDEQHGEKTYGQSSIDNAIASCREGYSGKKSKPTTAKVAKQSDAGAAEPWRLELMRRDSGSLLKNHYNAVMIVENAFPGLVGYNEFRQRIEARIPSPWRLEPGQWTEADTGELAFHIAKEYASFTLDALANAVMTVSYRHPFNPAQERLRASAEQWDGVPRLGTWLVDYLGAEHDASNGHYLREIGSAWLKGVAARVLFPGCKRDDVLVLRSEQGFLKSTAANAIADAIHPDSFTDSLGDLASKDAKASIRGIIVAELGELASLNKSDIESVKAFVAAKVDHFREAYGHCERDYPRTVSFIGTTNDPTFLKDPTGNRRWWPVTIPAPIDIPRLVEVLPQVLGEAARRVLNGEPWFVSDREALAQANEIRANHFQDDVWTEAVLSAADRLTIGAEYCTVAEIMNAMGVKIEQQTIPNQMRVGGILRVAGWTDKKRRIGRRSDNQTLRVWFPPVVPPPPLVPPMVPPTGM